MNENLPIQVEPIQEGGTITYATEVIAIIVGVATTEVDGIASMAGVSSISEILGGRNKNVARGVKVEVGAEEVSVDVSVIVDYGIPIQAVCQEVQENIRKSIETMTGLHVIKVDVHVQGVSFEKENKELQQSQQTARLESARASGETIPIPAAPAEWAQEPSPAAQPASPVAPEPSIPQEDAEKPQPDADPQPEPAPPESPKKRGPGRPKRQPKE
ncbi:MAG: Asp23/Gls24 family envelope stress response protein [Oscillospiraceae bacterium]|jgi:uncharacterized alkaline shock family protein YloU|nr:Asp23/Gls24 family envelope stress response protein [Oscillospiraceae bacterium]